MVPIPMPVACKRPVATNGHAHGAELPPGTSGLTYSISFVAVGRDLRHRLRHRHWRTNCKESGRSACLSLVLAPALAPTARTKADGDATDDTVAMAEAGGDNDHVTDADPPVPTVRKAAARTRRAA